MKVEELKLGQLVYSARCCGDSEYNEAGLVDAACIGESVEASLTVRAWVVIRRGETIRLTVVEDDCLSGERPDSMSPSRVQPIRKTVEEAKAAAVDQMLVQCRQEASLVESRSAMLTAWQKKHAG